MRITALSAPIRGLLTALAALALLAAPVMAQEIATIAPQPDEATLEQWAAEGVKTVVNMRTEAEMAELGYDERAAVEALGMDYVFIPVDSANATPDATMELARALDQADGKVALHCRSGSRAANTLAALSVERGEATAEDVQSPDSNLTLIPSLLARLSPRYAAQTGRGGDE